MNRHLLLLLVAGALPLSACSNYCSRGDNVRGHVSFGSAVDPEPRSKVIVEVSDDSFATIMDSRSIRNTQGFISLPYTLCAKTGTTVHVRAFQDTNLN